MADNQATATVPIDKPIQYFALDLQREGGTTLLPFFRDIVAIEQAIREAGEVGIQYDNLGEYAEHTDLHDGHWAELAEYTLTGLDQFEEHDTKTAIRVSQSDSDSDGVSYL